MDATEFQEILDEFDWVEYRPNQGTIDFVFDKHKTLRWNELFYFFCLDWAGYYFVARGWDFKRLQLQSRGFRFLLNNPHPCTPADLQKLCQDIAEMHLYDGQGRWIGHGVGTFVVLPDVPLS